MIPIYPQVLTLVLLAAAQAFYHQGPVQPGSGQALTGDKARQLASELTSKLSGTSESTLTIYLSGINN